MASMDLSSFVKEVEQYFGTAQGHKELTQAVIKQGDLNLSEATAPPDEAVVKFIEILKTHINNVPASDMSENVKDAFSDIISDGIVNNRDGTYTAWIHIMNMPRLSLAFSSSYAMGISDLAALYNNGVDHIMKQVYNREKGIGSKTEIRATHFIDDAIEEFLTAYGKKYNIISCEWVDNNY